MRNHDTFEQLNSCVNNNFVQFYIKYNFYLNSNVNLLILFQGYMKILNGNCL